MAQPVIEFRDPVTPSSILPSLTLTGSGGSGAIIAGQTSTPASVRIYNNYGQAGGISDALNCVLACYDDATHQTLAVTVPTTQYWFQVSVSDYNGAPANNDTDALGNPVYYPIGGAQKHAVLVNSGTIKSGVIPNPTVAPSLSAVAVSSSLLAGTYTVKYSYLSGSGETLVSPASTITITAGQGIQVAAISLISGATGINFYLSIAAGNSTVKQVASNQGQIINLTVLPGGGAASPPATNTTNYHYITVSNRVAVPVLANLTNVIQGLWIEYSYI